MSHEYIQIEALLTEKIGLKKGSISSRQIAKALEIRRLACDVPSLSDYLPLLTSSSQEWEQLLDLIVVCETWFFRHREAFKFLGDYVKNEWLKKQSSSILKVLSLPCATGEEPYSIAMTLLEVGLKPEQFQIEAIDISPQALLKAKIAVYKEQSFREDYSLQKSRYFSPISQGYQLYPFVRATVQFKLGNLLELYLPTYKPYHIIFCRHLLIYLDLSARSRAIDVLERLLAPDGLLFVGSPEMSWFKPPRFQVINYPYAFVYQKGKKSLESKSSIPKTKVKPNKPSHVNFNQSYKPEKKLSQKPIILNKAQAISNPQPVSHNPSLTSPKILLEARQLADAGTLEKAESLAKLYLKQAPSDPQAYLLLAQIYQAQGKEQQAEDYFQKVIYLNPNCEEALIHLALLKESRGDGSGASLIRQRIQRLINLKKDPL